MPTVFRQGPYRFFFYSAEGNPLEPPHIHITATGKVAKFWLDSVELTSSKRFRSHELDDMRRVVEQHRNTFLEAWYAHFSP